MPLQSLLTKPPAAVEAEAGLMAYDFWFLVCVGLSDLVLSNILAVGGCVP